MLELSFFGEGDDEMFKDAIPGLPKTVILPTPTSLNDFIENIKQLEYLGFEVDMVTADILDHLHDKEEGHYNLAVSQNEMLTAHEDSELEGDVVAYVGAYQEYAKDLLRLLIAHGLYVNGRLHYQLKLLNQAVLILEKLQIPLTDDEIKRRALARQIDIALRRHIPRTHV